MAETRRARYVSETAALVSGLAAGILSYILEQDLQSSVILSLVVALGLLIIKVISELADLSASSARAGIELKDVHALLLQRDEYMATFQHLNSDADRELATAVGRLHGALTKTPPALFGLVAELLNGPVETLERGHIVTPGDSSSLSSHLVQTFEEDVFTTSLHPLEFWLTVYGRNYNEATCNRIGELTAARRRVRFRRVFIVRDSSASDLRSGPYREIIDRQRAAGIDVRIATESLLPGDLRVDFGLWDGRLEVELESDERRKIIARHYRYTHDALRTAERRAERIWDRSVPFEAWLAERDTR